MLLHFPLNSTSSGVVLQAYVLVSENILSPNSFIIQTIIQSKAFFLVRLFISVSLLSSIIEKNIILTGLMIQIICHETLFGK